MFIQGMNDSTYLAKLIPQNYGAFFDIIGAGITGPVSLKSAKTGSSMDLSSQQWTYQVCCILINDKNLLSYLLLFSSCNGG